jgi:DNA invertase Pin-like site-specific DNA recombinase
LDKEKAQQIRQLLFKGTPVKTIAEAFGINRSLVGKIRRGENWA